MRKIVIAICLLAICDIGMIVSILIPQQGDRGTLEVMKVMSVERDKDTPKIALTFDDGPHPKFTKELLEGLEKRNVKATFFVTGENVVLYPEIVQQIDKGGHLIGNHTYTHLELTNQNHNKFKEELYQTNEAIKEIIGKETEFVRPPYGKWSESIEKEVMMFPILWTVDPLDWCTQDVGKVVGIVVENITENDIILLHDCYQSTVEATLEIVDLLQEQGYEFVTVDKIVFE